MLGTEQQGVKQDDVKQYDGQLELEEQDGERLDELHDVEVLPHELNDGELVQYAQDGVEQLGLDEQVPMVYEEEQQLHELHGEWELELGQHGEDQLIHELHDEVLGFDMEADLEVVNDQHHHHELHDEP